MSRIFNYRGMEGILRRTIQIKDAFFDSSHAVKDGRWQRHITLYSLMQFGQVLDLRIEVLLGICGPEEDDLVCFCFHSLNILSELRYYLLISTRDNVVCSVDLVGCDEVAIQCSRHGINRGEVRFELSDKVWLEHL